MSVMDDIPKSIAIQVTPDEVSSIDVVKDAAAITPSRTAVAAEAFRRGLPLLVAETKRGEANGKRKAARGAKS